MEQNFTYKAVVTQVVDGDTLKLEIDLGFHIVYNLVVRLYGIDTPEVYGVKKDSEEYLAGQKASQFTKDWVAAQGNNILVCTSKGTEKYGRWLAEVYSLDGAHHLNKEIVEAGYAIYRTY